MSVSKDISSKISNDRIKLQEQIIGQFEEDTQLKIFCEKHENQLILEMCCNPNCDKKDSLFCSKCIQKDLRHKDECQLFIMPLEIGIQQISNRFLAICPENTQEVYREQYDQLAFSEKQNLGEFERFLRTQRNKVEKDIRAISEAFQQYMENIRQDLDRRLEDQLRIYKKNYGHFKNLLDSSQGADYKILRECSEYKNIFKRINNSSDNEAYKFLGDILKLLKQYTIGDKATEQSVNQIQGLFLLLTEQTTNPPTFQAHNFEAFSLSSIKLQVEMLSNKIIESLEQNLLNTPLEKFVAEEEPDNNQSLLASQSTEQTTKRLSRASTSRIALHPNQPEYSYFDDSDISSDVFIREKLLHKSLNNSVSPTKKDSFINFRESLGPAPKINRVAGSPNQSFSECLEKSRISFSHEKKNCLIKQNQKNFFLERSQSTRSLQVSENVCVTSLVVLAENIVAIGLTNNYIHIYHMETNKLLQEIECKNWIYSLSTLKLPTTSTILKSVSEQIAEDPERKMSEYGFKLLGGSENSVKIWDTNFVKDQKIYPVMEFRREGFFRGMSLVDLEDEFNLVCGDWDGRIYIWDYVADNMLFKLDTQGQIVHRLQLLKKQNIFISAHRIDYNQGGILVWQLEYDLNTCPPDNFGQIQQSRADDDSSQNVPNPMLATVAGGMNVTLGGLPQMAHAQSQYQNNQGQGSSPKNGSKNQLIRCSLLRRLEEANSVNCFISLKTNPDYIVTSERNHIKLWDIREKKLIKTLYKGESKARDILLIENSSSGSNYFVTLFANNSVMKMIDSNEFLVGQYQLEDYPCDQCRKYFHSSKMSFLEAQDGQLYVVVVRHKHICNHFSEYMTQQQFSQIEKQSSLSLQQHIKSQNEHNKEFEKCILFTRLSLQGLKLSIAKSSQKQY